MAKENWESYFDAVKKQDWKSAKEVLQQIAKTERNNSQTFLKIGDICQRTGEKQEAISAYLHAAQVLRMQGFAQKALATYKIALRLDPENQEIIRRAEILIDEFEATKTTPHLAVSQTVEIVPAEQEPITEESEAPSPEVSRTPEWLETTSVAPPVQEQEIEEIKPSEWLEMTALKEEKSSGEQSEQEAPAVFEPAAPPQEQGTDQPAQAFAEAPEENAEWLESAYEALDTRMFKPGTESPEQPSSGLEISDEPVYFEPTQLTSDEIADNIQEMQIPLTERYDVSTPDIFSDLPEDMIKSFMSELSVLTFNDGQKVIEEGDSGDSMYIIKSGQANVVAHLLGKRVELALLGEGDIFGEVGFLTGRPRTASVIAAGQLKIYEINRLEVEKLIETSPDILAKIEDFYEMRVRDTIKKIKS